MAKESLDLYNLSDFPEKIDGYVPVYDLPPEMVTKAKALQELLMKPILTSQERLEQNQLMEDLDSYKIDPIKWNKMCGSLQAMQIFMKDNFFDYIQMLKDELEHSYESFRFVGDYDKDKTYEFQNIVRYKGDSYIALKDVPVNKDPVVSPEYWEVISTKGEKGDTGLSINMKGRYDSNNSYQMGDGVIDDGGLIYYAYQDVPAGIDPSNTDYWILYDNFIVSTEKPQYVQSGVLWIQPVGKVMQVEEV